MNSIAQEARSRQRAVKYAQKHGATEAGIRYKVSRMSIYRWIKQLLVKDPNDKTLFETALEEMGILYHRIRVATPRHNGKVERQHRLDEERFYSKMRMNSLADGRKQLARYNRISNNISKSCLKYRSPIAVPADYLAVL